MEPVLQNVAPDIDESRVGISYSGGGPLLLIELGIAQAFVDLKIVPVAIAGVSAGAIAGTAHALDPVNGTGIKAAADALLTLSDHKLGLTRAEIVAKLLGSLITMLKLPLSLGDNAPIQPMVEGVFNGLSGQPTLTVAEFGTDPRTTLYIGGTDRRACERYWFPASAEVADALVASSAIPGVFPPRKITIDGQEMLFVDGAVAQNQPLSQLVLAERCGTLYACAVGYDGEHMGDPPDALENAMSAISILSHESSRLEQGYVELKLKEAGKGNVYHIHPEGPFNISGFNFTADQIKQVIDLASQQTKRYIQQQGWMPPAVAAPAAAPVPVGAPVARPELERVELSSGTAQDRALTPMDVSQFFETTIVDRQFATPLRFLSVPSRAIAVRTANDEAIAALGLESTKVVRTPGELASALANILVQEGEQSDEALRFATYCVETELIPFEQSPLDLASLGGLLTASASGVGAVIGFVAGGSTPLVLITVPAGMIICGAAVAVSKALETGLQYRLLKLMGVPQPAPSQPAPASAATAAGGGQVR